MRFQKVISQVNVFRRTATRTAMMVMGKRHIVGNLIHGKPVTTALVKRRVPL